MFIPDYPIFAVSKEVLTSSEKLVLLAIKFHIGNHPDSYVPQETIAVETSLCRNTVINATQKLRAKGWIKIRKRRNCSHIYSLVADKFKMQSTDKPATKVEALGIQQHNDCAGESLKAKSFDKAKHNDCAIESTTNMHKVVNTKITNQDLKPKSKDSAAIAAQNYSQNLHDSVEGKNSINKENGVKELEALWREALPKHFPNDSVIPKFSAANYKMLKEFSTLVSPHNAIDVLLCIIENWHEFKTYAKEQYSAFPIPQIPTLDFILKQKNMPAAVNYYNKQKNPEFDEFASFKHH